jgi:hypothetical protein
MDDYPRIVLWDEVDADGKFAEPAPLLQLLPARRRTTDMSPHSGMGKVLPFVRPRNAARRKANAR